MSELHHLAYLYGVQTAYHDVLGREQHAADESLLRVLQILGAPLARVADAGDAVRQRRRQTWTTPLEPVTVAWLDEPGSVPVRVPADRAGAAFAYTLELEDGDPIHWTGTLDELSEVHGEDVEGVRYIVKRLPLPHPLPPGYHRLNLDLSGASAQTLVIAAPRRAPGYRPFHRGNAWGVFAPLYALHSERSWGVGDLSDMAELMTWTAEHGGSLVGTLPLLASYWQETGDYSPYSPASRLFWNEYYLDVTVLPEFAASAAAQALLASDDARRDLAALRAGRQVDYPRFLALKRRVIQLLADEAFASAERGTRNAECLHSYMDRQPEAEQFARFRAAQAEHGFDWTRWPNEVAARRAPHAARRAAEYRYHLYAQWRTDEQVQRLTQEARERDLTWYLDYPLGVHRLGYDVWRTPEVFAVGAAGGCPPDPVFTKGQNWGFPPMHPEGLRRQEYRYLIAALRMQLPYARLLRLDHVMGLYRLFWVPEGMEAKDGVFVRYPMEELFAVHTLEAHRHQAGLVGENLGTVPPEVDQALVRHNVDGMFIMQYELRGDPNQALRPVPLGVAASLDTHDMHPFMSFWEGKDIADRHSLGLLDDGAAAHEQHVRGGQKWALVEFLRRRGLLAHDRDDAEAVLEATLGYLASSEGRVLLVNLEDLWLETQPQNTPGTYFERPNWRSKFRFGMEEIRQHSGVLRLLRLVEEWRRQAAPAVPAEERLVPGGPHVRPGIVTRKDNEERRASYPSAPLECGGL